MKVSKKFGLLDVVIVAVLIGGVAIFGNRMLKEETESEEKVALEYTFETLEVGQEFVDQLKVGDEVFHSIKNEKIGVIKSFKTEPYKIEHRNLEAGTIDIVEEPDKYRVLIEIESEATLAEEDNILVGSEELRVGKSVPLKGIGYATFGYIVEIEK